MNLTIPLSRTGEPLFRQIYSGLRSAILSGGFREGERLPSTRALAEGLGVSRTIVLLAYEQLLAEGFARSREGSGTFVADEIFQRTRPRQTDTARLRLSRYGAAAAAAAAEIDFTVRRPGSLRYDFAYGRGDVAEFPFESWHRSLLNHARRTSLRGLQYGEASGLPSLREAIAVHLRRSRAVMCEPSQVIIVNGSQQALDLVARVLIDFGDPVAIEDPQYQGARVALRTAGAKLHPVRVDDEGLDPAKLPTGAKVAFVTPSHQFPTGAILPLARRLALLSWARRNDAIVVEDDYDGEFRYDGQPLESLQGLDTEGRVIYLGTFSRTIFSALRLGYLVVPKPLIPAFASAKWLVDRHTATLEQHALAEFINSGLYERYLRRVRRSNATRRKTLLSAIADHLPEGSEVTGAGAGAHVVIWPKRPVSEEDITVEAAARDVGVYGIARYFIGRARPGFLLGYSQLTSTEIHEGIRRFGEVLRSRTG